MTTLSRKCVPFTPFERELAKSNIAIVTAAGVHLREQEPFNIADELGDLDPQGGQVLPINRHCLADVRLASQFDVIARHSL